MKNAYESSEIDIYNKNDVEHVPVPPFPYHAVDRFMFYFSSTSNKKLFIYFLSL